MASIAVWREFAVRDGFERFHAVACLAAYSPNLLGNHGGGVLKRELLIHMTFQKATLFMP